MNIQAIQTFLAILETGSLARAAAVMNVTQSTVTARLKTLEEQVGQPLIRRRKSGAAPTASGIRFRRYAETIVGLWRQARLEAGLPGATSVVCNIGCCPDLWPALGKSLFDHIRSRDAGAALTVWQGGEAEIEDRLREGLIDIALTYRPPATQTHVAEALAPDRLILVSSRPDTPVRGDPTYFFVEAGEEFGRDHAAAYADTGTARIVFGAAHLGLEHILTAGGTCYLPERMAAPHVVAGRLFRLDAPEFERRVYLAVDPVAAAGWNWLPDWVDPRRDGLIA